MNFYGMKLEILLAISLTNNVTYLDDGLPIGFQKQVTSGFLCRKFIHENVSIISDIIRGKIEPILPISISSSVMILTLRLLLNTSLAHNQRHTSVEARKKDSSQTSAIIPFKKLYNVPSCLSNSEEDRNILNFCYQI